MRRLGHGLLVALMLAALAWGLTLGSRAWTAWQLGQSPHAGGDGDGSLSWGLRQPAGSWVAYPIPADALEVRVLSNLLHPDPRRLDRDYVLEYRLETSLGGALATGEVHVSARAPTGMRRLPTLSGSALSVAATREFVVPRTDPRQRRIRLRWRSNQAGEDVAQVFLRVYSRNQLNARQLTQRWRSLTEKERRSLAAIFVQPLEWLSDGERAGMVARAWRPLATSDDIGLEMLRVPDADEPGAIAGDASATLPSGDRLDSDHERTYGLREGPVTVLLHSVGQAGARVHVRAVDDSGRSLLDRQVVTTASTRLVLPHGPGQVRFRADAPVTIDLPLADRPAMTTATLTRYLQVAEGALFDLTATAVARHLRVSALLPGPASGIVLEGLDASDAVAWRQSLGASAMPSAALQDLRQPDRVLWVEPPVYLSLPASITRLRVTGPADALVRVASRPASLPLVRGLGARAASQPDWFEMQPAGSVELAWRWIERQRPLRAAPSNPGAADTVHPLAAAAGAARGLVLIPSAAGHDPTCMGPYVPGMTLRSGSGQGDADVRLVYFSTHPVAGFVTTEIAGQRHVWPVSGRSGYWRPTRLPTGAARLLVLPGPLDDAAIWAGPVPAAHCQRRLRETWRVGGSGLTFAVPVLKPGQSLRLQVMAPSASTGSLQLALEGGQMDVSSSTYPARAWHLPLSAADTPVQALGELTQLQMPRTLTLAVAASAPANLRLRVAGLGAGRLAMVRAWVQEAASNTPAGTPSDAGEEDAPGLESEP